MLEKIGIYFSIVTTSAVKFIAGPTIGAVSDLSILETAFFTAIGMMLTVTLFTFFGPQMRKVIRYLSPKKRKIFSKRSRRFVVIWQKYGIPGTAFLTPLILTPIGGAILVNAFKSPVGKIFLYMSISAAFWGVFFSALVKYAKDFIL